VMISIIDLCVILCVSFTICTFANLALPCSNFGSCKFKPARFFIHYANGDVGAAGHSARRLCCIDFLRKGRPRSCHQDCRALLVVARSTITFDHSPKKISQHTPKICLDRSHERGDKQGITPRAYKQKTSITIRISIIIQ